MTSLYKRASPTQQRMLRAIEGAIVNAAHAHSEIKISPRFRRSIAKRATGTLSSQWPEVLAATRRSGGQAKPMPSKRRGDIDKTPRLRTLIRLSMERVARHRCNLPSEAGAKGYGSLPLLVMAEKCLQACASPIRKTGDLELYEAVVAVLRILGRRRKGLIAPDTLVRLASGAPLVRRYGGQPRPPTW